MTVVAAFRLGDNAMVLSDSRGTWDPDGRTQDELQKLLPLGRRFGLAYAGNAVLAEQIAEAVRDKVSSDERGKVPAYFAPVLTKIARDCDAGIGVEILLFCAPENGPAELWHYSSDRDL